MDSPSSLFSLIPEPIFFKFSMHYLYISRGSRQVKVLDVRQSTITNVVSS